MSAGGQVGLGQTHSALRADVSGKRFPGGEGLTYRIAVEYDWTFEVELLLFFKVVITPRLLVSHMSGIRHYDKKLKGNDKNNNNQDSNANNKNEVIIVHI